MRIGLFTDTYPPYINGVANSTHILRNELVKMGHEVYVVTTYHGIGQHKWNEDHTILQLAGPELKFLYGYVATSPIHLKAQEEVKKLNLDIIHAQTEFGVGIFARICARLMKIPLVSTYHTTYEDYTHYINFINSRTVDNIAKLAVAKLSRLYGDSSMAVIAPSQKTKDMLLGYHVRREISVIPTGLVLDQFSPSHNNPQFTRQLRDQYHVQDDERLIIYVGRLAEEKALDLVIRGFHRAVEQGVKVKLLIVGGGPDFDSLQNLAKEMHCEDHIFLAGPQPAETIADYYRSADAFISASLTETQGMTFIEALASGLPLFARRDEVLENLLYDNRTGWYFTDEDDLCEKLKQFMELTDDTLAAMKQTCIDTVQPYSSDVFGKRVEAVYLKTIEEYRHQYRIDNIRMKDTLVQLYLISNQDEELRLSVSLDDFYEMGMQRDGYLTASQIEELRIREEAALAYQKCIRKLAVKDRTCKEIYDYLTKETNCDINTVNGIVDKLEEQGFLNDTRLCEHQIEFMKKAGLGHDRIVRNLKKRGIPYEMIEECLSGRMDDERENAEKYARKLQLTHRHDSLRKTKEYIRSRMITQGFSSDLAKEVVDNMDFSENLLQEDDNLRRYVLKTYRRLEHKYKGAELRNRIFRACVKQGYQHEDITAVLDELELNYEKD
ncbi:MAG: glycosyltransferase [Bulleidia sp.]